jgi:polyphosphate kinase
VYGYHVEPMQSDDAQLFINRELSMLAFQERVLDEARDPATPLYERVKFLGIVAGNLDEFFMVRVAGVKQQVQGGVLDKTPDGLPPMEQLGSIGRKAHALAVEQYRVWQELAALAAASGVHMLSGMELTAEQQAAAKEHFLSQVFPALTPLAVDPAHPFPHVKNKSLNVAVRLRRKDLTLKKQPKKKRVGRDAQSPSELAFAIVQMPTVVARFVKLPAASGTAWLPLEDLIALHAGELFPGFDVAEKAFFRVTRNWDLDIDDEESEDLVSTVQEELRRRDRGMAVRLELGSGASDELERILCMALSLSGDEVYRQDGPLQLQDLAQLADVDPRPELHVEPFTPSHPAFLKDAERTFDVVRDRDVLLHHPYESFDPVVRFLEEAADDPDVLAIKMTLYRTSGNSPFVRALSRAAENGKQVAVLVEIKARFDEANNIAWARRLEEAGCHVVYGLIGLKTHAKVCLVVRREGQSIRRYIHLATGNYNPTTARIYTDVSLFTARPEIADDVSALFNMLTGLSDVPKWKRVTVAPLGLQERVLQLIEREAEKAKKGEPARILGKMNALVDPVVIRALYAAAQAGVEMDFVVRGICSLRPGVPGLSEKIRVTSIVDRFLEHSRVFVFGTGKDADVYLSSADWMQRNFHRRIEVMFPVEDPALKVRAIDEIMKYALADNVKTRRLRADGEYERVVPDGAAIRCQASLMAAAQQAVDVKPTPVTQPVWKTEAARITLVPRTAT